MTTPEAIATDDKSPTQQSSEQQSSSSSTTTTRICIKNLPLSITNESKLKNHLLQSSSSLQLQITDVKILKTTEGKSRRIAFIGFSTPQQASAAVSYYNKSFIGTSKLNVSLAFSKKKHSKEKEEYRPWSKFSVGSSRYDKLHNNQQQNEEDGDTTKDKEQTNEVKTEADRKRDEFLSAMGISTASTSNNNKQKDTNVAVSKSKFWSNDDAMEVEQQIDETNQNKDVDVNSDSDSSSESDSISSSSDSDESKDEETNTSNTKAKVSSDLDFLKSKQVKADILSDDDEGDKEDDKKGDESDSSSSVDSDSDDSSDSDDDSSEDEADKKDTPQATSNKVSSSKETADTHHQPSNTTTATATLNDRLFVRNLPFTTTEEELYETFTNFGNVTSVHIPVDDTKRNKGYAFITYEHYKHAKLALETMDGEDFQGRLIHILPARPSSVDQLELEGGDNDLTYKEKQALARQKEAEKTSMGLSASYLRGDAVVDNVADRLGVSKGDVLNVKDGISSGNAAVRLALGETHIISENIAFFEEHGVDVTALENNNTRKHGRGSGDVKSKRSKTMILVKNLPYDTTLEELTKVFHGIGGDVPQRMLLPPSKTAALVEYGHATDARRAFRRLAYKKFKHVPLYLEMAPMMAESSKRQQESTAAPKEDDKTTKKSDSTVNDTAVKQGVVDHTESVDNTGVSQTVYVKNLNFSTTEEQLEKAFTKAGCQPRAVKIPTKAAPVKKHKAAKAAQSSQEMRQVSMGFGFVEFASEEEALQSIKKLQGKLVDGHSLEIKLSTKSLSSSSSKAPPIDKSSKNTKIMVRNVPFEATRTELLQLFGSFGQLKKVRLPKKFDGTHRGFAFCEFVTSKEAQNAMTTLSRTHLYGRHLVLEWATQGEDDGNTAENVSVAREKAKRDAMSAGFGTSGKKKGKHLKF